MSSFESRLQFQRTQLTPVGSASDRELFSDDFDHYTGDSPELIEEVSIDTDNETSDSENESLEGDRETMPESPTTIPHIPRPILTRSNPRSHFDNIFSVLPNGIFLSPPSFFDNMDDSGDFLESPQSVSSSLSFQASRHPQNVESDMAELFSGYRS